MRDTLHIIGGGMAGSEAAWQAANKGVPVVLHEMRPQVGTFAHRTGNLAEMDCSNSFRSDDDERNAVGLLHWEMGAADGLIMQTARAHRLPAGGALAVDRDPFAVDAGSFTAATHLLGVPTSTVSTRVARLERRLGVTLLQRTTRRLSLTDAGSLYYQHAATGLGHMLDAEAAVTESAGEPKGLLRDTAPADIGDALLADIVRQMHRRYPQVGIDLLLVSHYVDLVAEGFDVAIRAGSLKDSTLIAKPVGMARWVPFASPDYLASAPPHDSPQALRHQCCLQFMPLGKESWTLNGPAGSVTVPLPGLVMINDVRVIRAMPWPAKGSPCCRPRLIMSFQQPYRLPKTSNTPPCDLLRMLTRS